MYRSHSSRHRKVSVVSVANLGKAHRRETDLCAQSLLSSQLCSHPAQTAVQALMGAEHWDLDFLQGQGSSTRPVFAMLTQSCQSSPTRLGCEVKVINFCSAKKGEKSHLEQFQYFPCCPLTNPHHRLLY